MRCLVACRDSGRLFGFMGAGLWWDEVGGGMGLEGA